MSDEEINEKVLSGSCVIHYVNSCYDDCIWYYDRERQSMRFIQYSRNGEVLFREIAFSQNPSVIMGRNNMYKLVPKSSCNKLLNRVVSSVRYVW